MDACTSTTITTGKTTPTDGLRKVYLHLTIHPMSLQPFEVTASSAYSVGFTTQDTPVTADLVLFDVGTYIGFVIFADRVPPSITTADGFVNEAIDNVSGMAGP